MERPFDPLMTCCPSAVGTVLSWETERGAQPSCASRAWQDVWLQRDISLSHLLKNLPANEGDADSCGAEHVSKEKTDGRGTAHQRATPAFLICIVTGEWYQTHC